MKEWRSKILRTIQERNNIDERLALPYIKIYDKAAVIKNMILVWGGKQNEELEIDSNLYERKYMNIWERWYYKSKGNHRPFNKLYYINWSPIFKKWFLSQTVPQNKLQGL